MDNGRYRKKAEKRSGGTHAAGKKDDHMELQFASRMKDYEEGIFQVLNEKKEELAPEGPGRLQRHGTAFQMRTGLY